MSAVKPTAEDYEKALCMAHIKSTHPRRLCSRDNGKRFAQWSDCVDYVRETAADIASHRQSKGDYISDELIPIEAIALGHLKALVQEWQNLDFAAAGSPELMARLNCAKQLAREIERMESEPQGGARTAETPETGALQGYEFRIVPDHPYQPYVGVRKPNGVEMILTKGDFLYELCCILANNRSAPQ